MDQNKAGRKNPMTELLSLPDKGIHSANEILSILWRGILADCNITPPQWALYLNEWYTATYEMYGTSKESVSAKSNITGRLSNERMTFNVFLTGLAILKFYKVNIRLTLTRVVNGKEVEVIKNFPIADVRKVLKKK